MRSAPPIVPGMPRRNASPAIPASAPPWRPSRPLPPRRPARGRLGSTAMSWKPLPSRITTPGTPPSRTSRLEPSPTTMTGMSRRQIPPGIARESASSAGLNSASAGPPVRNQGRAQAARSPRANREAGASGAAARDDVGEGHARTCATEAPCAPHTAGSPVRVRWARGGSLLSRRHRPDRPGFSARCGDRVIPSARRSFLLPPRRCRRSRRMRVTMVADPSGHSRRTSPLIRPFGAPSPLGRRMRAP